MNNPLYWRRDSKAKSDKESNLVGSTTNDLNVPVNTTSSTDLKVDDRGASPDKGSVSLLPGSDKEEEQGPHGPALLQQEPVANANISIVDTTEVNSEVTGHKPDTNGTKSETASLNTETNTLKTDEHSIKTSPKGSNDSDHVGQSNIAGLARSELHPAPLPSISIEPNSRSSPNITSNLELKAPKNLDDSINDPEIPDQAAAASSQAIVSIPATQEQSRLTSFLIPTINIRGQRSYSWWKSEGVEADRRGSNWWYWNSDQTSNSAVDDCEDQVSPNASHQSDPANDAIEVNSIKINEPLDTKIDKVEEQDSTKMIIVPTIVRDNTGEFDSKGDASITSTEDTNQNNAKKTTGSIDQEVTKSANQGIQKANNGGNKGETVNQKAIELANPDERSKDATKSTPQTIVPVSPTNVEQTIPAESAYPLVHATQDALQDAQNSSTPLSPQENWVDWSFQYRRVSTVFSYINRGSVVDPHETTPLLKESLRLESGPSLQQSPAIFSQADSESPAPEPAGWFSWLWSKRIDEDDDESGVDEGTTELYKSAKSAIESSRESSHYAFKSSVKNWQPKQHHQHGYHNQQQLELAVSDTLTESQPVKYRSKKRPLTPNEVQELTLQTHPSPSTSQVQQPVSRGSASPLPPLIHSRDTRVLPHIDNNFRTITIRTSLRLRLEDIYRKKHTEKHLYKCTPANILDKKTNKIKKVVIIGVHGFLPIKLVKSLIGQSTGNSIAFVNVAARAVQRWLKENNDSFDVANYDIQTIALEGEGKINERVDKLLKLLKNWRSILEESDFIFMVSHSQGVPVAINLLADLLDLLEVSSPHPRKIGLLSMAGIISGPFLDLDNKIVTRAYTPREREIISEVFELQKPNSPTSLQLDQSMKRLIKHNVKISLAGSINDQFVPLTSALGQKYTHPNIFRFTHINSSTSKDIPLFVVQFLATVIAMTNVGWTRDYKLLSDVGLQCTGTVGSEGGHCKMYSDDSVYYLAIKHALESTSLVYPGKHALDVRAGNFSGRVSITNGENVSPINIYDIPWNTRSLLHDLVRIPHIGNLALIRSLVREFARWEPTQKNWKELKMLFSGFESLDMEELV